MNAGGPETSSTIVVALVDTNVLVYRYDARFPAKQTIADDLLRRGLAEETLRVAHPALVEFVAATTRRQATGDSILDAATARLEAEDLSRQFHVVFPDAQVFRTALHGMATYQLPWFDAHMWAFAEVYRLRTLYSEDFQHGRWYGTVRAVDPFRGE